MRYIKNLALVVAFVGLCGFGGSNSGGGSGSGVSSISVTAPITSTGGGTPNIGITLPLTGNAVTLAGDVTGASNANTAVGSSNLQQPVMFIGSTAKTVSTAATTGTITTPTGTANGDLELVYIQFNNTTSSGFTPPAGWATVSNCNASGNTNQGQMFSHTASSEGGTIAAFTWTTNATAEIWAGAFRNAAIDTCAMTTAAAGTTFTASSLTAAATTDKILAFGGQPISGGYISSTAAPTGTQRILQQTSNTSYGQAADLYPITSTTVAGYGYTSGVSAAWVGGQIALSFATSTTAGPPGAATYNQFGAYLGALTLGTQSVATDVTLGGAKYSIMMPNTGSGTVGGIGTIDTRGRVVSMVAPTDTGGVFSLSLGDPNAENSSSKVVSTAAFQVKSDNSVSTLPRTAIAFSIAQTSVSTGVNLSCTKTPNAITIENDEGTWSIGASCSGQVIRVYDCGTSAPANASCSGGTQLTTNTYSVTAGTVTDGTISNANVAAGHYMCAQIQASGSCTTMYGQETLMARPQ